MRNFNCFVQMRVLRIVRSAVLLLVAAAVGFAQQVPPQSLMTIDIDNAVFYRRDVMELSRLATETRPTPAAVARNFSFSEGIGDIVAVNSKPMRGTFHSRVFQLFLDPNPQPGQGIADVITTGTLDWIMDIRTPDGQPVGLITGYGWNTPEGQRPPGAPSRLAFLNMVITGGTGAYVGIRGQMGLNITERPAEMPAPPPMPRIGPSITEDPGYRRVNGPGQTRRHVLQIFPMFVPEILEIWRSSDFSRVTVERPVTGGEMVTLVVSNLGPVRGAVEPGQPFPSEPLAIVNSPVEVLVSGREAQVVNAVGWPGFADRYRVDFKLPEGLAPGMATIQIKAAFLNGGVSQIPVR